MSDSSSVVKGELKVIQTSFIGGMRRNVDPTKLNPDEYTLLINGRNRYDVIQPVKEPLQLVNGLPSGNYQGVYGAGPFLIVFIDGYAYYRIFSETSQTDYFNKVSSFKMDSLVQTLFAELIPSATINSFRKAVGETINGGVDLIGASSGSPQALVVQDGVNQPWIITPDAGARVTGGYKDWVQNQDNINADNREYVPVGKQMLYHNGILYIISPDGKQIFRSVTGRPLDSIVAVNQDGDKISNDEKIGGAEALSHKVDFDSVTCISRINSANGGFLVTTSRNSYAVIPNFNRTLYGEPTFNTSFLFSTGALNNFSVVDILGDTALIDFSGVRSFNSIKQTLIEGNNSPFSSEIFPLLEGIIQTQTAAITFDNYVFFAVTTVYGPGIIIYDTLRAKYVGIDFYTGVGAIKQFAEIKTAGSRLLFFITDDNKLYQAFGGSATAPCKLYTKEFTSDDPEVEHQTNMLRLVFIDVAEDGAVSVTPYVDRKKGLTLRKSIKANFTDIAFPKVPPFGDSSTRTSQNRTFKFQNSSRGWKTGYWIEWSNNMQLSHIAVVSSAIKGNTSFEEQVAAYEKS